MMKKCFVLFVMIYLVLSLPAVQWIIRLRLSAVIQQLVFTMILWEILWEAQHTMTGNMLWS